MPLPTQEIFQRRNSQVDSTLQRLAVATLTLFKAQETPSVKDN
jgi:hypothetical protein